MTTITAVELRKNMGEILRRVAGGEEIIVTYRDHTKVRMSSDRRTDSGELPKRMAGLDALLKAPRKPSTLDPNKPIKELYHEMLDEKYGIK